MPGEGAFLYFAYGSNLLPQRLRQRCPSSRLVCRAELAGHQLRFHKLGMDGSAKCDAWRTDDPGHRLPGVIYRIAGAERRALDAAEDLDVGYRALQLEFSSPSGAISALIYCALPDKIRTSLLPFDWYHALVLAGARQHDFLEEYLAEIERVAVMPDPDRSRAEHHFQLCRQQADPQ